MTTKRNAPRSATETVWLARMDLNQQDFSGMYILCSPDPPLLERRRYSTLCWSFGNMCIPSSIFHPAIKGIRLQPGEGPRKIELTIKRAPGRVWIEQYPADPTHRGSSYIVAIGNRPDLAVTKAARALLKKRSFTISAPDFLTKFSGISPSPGDPPITVAITATPIDVKADFANDRKKH